MTSRLGLVILSFAWITTAHNAQAQVPQSFHDDFEIDRDWFQFEEIVGGNVCYGDGIGSITRSGTQSSSPAHSLQLWPNQAGTLLSNHLSAVHRVEYAGRGGKWRYSVRAYIDPAYPVYQVGPEFSMQNTKQVESGQFLTYIGAVQYQASPWLPDQGSWRVWAETGAGVADWLPLGYEPLTAGQWYTLSIDVDYGTNRYLRFTVDGPSLHHIFDLTNVRIAGQNMFSEATFDLTLESENLWNNCGVDGSWQNRIYYDDIDLAPSVTPSFVSLAPNSGSGTRATFNLDFSTGSLSNSIDVANILINQSLDGAGACYLAYSRPLNVLYLMNDAGTALLPGIALNGTGQLNNSKCTINGAGSQATVKGSTLTLTLDISLAPIQVIGGPYNTAGQIIYAAARDASGGNSGWQVAGVWSVPGSPPVLPLAYLQSPGSGSTTTQTFQTVLRDAISGTSFTNAQMLINRDLDGRGACWIGFSTADGLLYLVDDDGSTLLPPLKMGQPATRENSLCRINGALSSSTVSGTDLILNLNVSFKTPFIDYLIYSSASGPRSSGWLAVGMWTAPAL